MTTPKPRPKADDRAWSPAAESWHEIVQAGTDQTQIEGFALEHLIDLARDRAPATRANR